MDNNIIGGKITKARKDNNMSQAQLAQQLFISPQAVGKWERGESTPDIITINRLAEILGVDLNYFSEKFPSATDKPVSNTSREDAGSTKHPGQIAADSLPPQSPQLITNFSGSNLSKSDLAGVTAHGMMFKGSELGGVDFAGSDLTGSSFKGSNLQAADFNSTNLTDCVLYASDATDATFNKSILLRTEFNASGLAGAKFSDASLEETKLTATDLRKTIFENCAFNGVDFKHSDLRGVCLDGQTFTGVKFHDTALNNASFKGARLENISFRAPFAITNKYYRAIKTICFDGASMDKLTYASLKGLGADLSKVTTI